MKRLFCVLTLVLLFALPSFSQAYSAFTATYAHRIAPLPALPATCDPANGELVFLTTAPVGLHSCAAANTWRSAGTTGMSLQLAQGTLTASNPGLNLTATWNAGAVTFTEILANITNTASAAASLLMDLQVGGASQFSVGVAGVVTSNSYVYPGNVAFAALGAPADGAIVYCPDCAIGAVCAGAGTGALAKRLNGAWVCN